jgi:hypothetical protein
MVASRRAGAGGSAQAVRLVAKVSGASTSFLPKKKVS